MEGTRHQHSLAAAAAASGDSGAAPGFPSELAGLDPVAAGQLLASGELGVDSRALHSGKNSMGLGGSGVGALAGMESGLPEPSGYHKYSQDAAAGTPAVLEAQSAERFAELLRGGGVPVVLGQNGQAVSGPTGEPVIVGPDGQELTIEPSGNLRPFMAGRGSAYH